MGVSPSASLPCQLPFILWENLKTRRALRRAFRKAEDAGIPAYVKDDNAAKGVPVCPAGICALVKRRYLLFSIKTDCVPEAEAALSREPFCKRRCTTPYTSVDGIFLEKFPKFEKFFLNFYITDNTTLSAPARGA